MRRPVPVLRHGPVRPWVSELCRLPGLVDDLAFIRSMYVNLTPSRPIY